MARSSRSRQPAGPAGPPSRDDLPPAAGPSRRRFLRVAGRVLAAALSLPGVAWAQEKVHAIHSATRNTPGGALGVRLRRLFGGRPVPFKRYPGAPRTALPGWRRKELAPAASVASAVREHRPAEGFAGAAVDFPTLARVLDSANGVTARRGSVALRAAPSAGALYAGEVYVVAERVKGLAPGIYYYAALSRELVLLKPGSRLTAVAKALEQPLRARRAAFAVLLTNVFPRYRWRYANRGYRYALIDSGHIGENLRLSATSAGLAEWGPRRFEDDRLNRLLGIDGLDEAVCAVHLVGARGSAPSTDAPTRELVEAASAGNPLPDEADDAPDRFHAWTKLAPAGPGVKTRRPRLDEADLAPLAPSSPTLRPGSIELPTRDDPGLPVEHAIARRRSARRFEPGPILGRDLGYVLETAIGDPTLPHGTGIELLLFIHRPVAIASDTRLAPGLYRGSLGSRRLARVREGDLAEALVAACLGQEKAGQAAVGIAMVGRLEDAARRDGERSYRDLCLECGAVGQRVYLAAESAGIAARNLAAYVDDDLNALAGLDGRRRAVLHLTMLGPGD